MIRIIRKMLLVMMLVAVTSCLGAESTPAVGAVPAPATFVHPGGLHTLADLERMKAKVAAGEHPWIDSWKAFCEHPKAQSNYVARPRANMAASRQQASADAVAAYMNAIRWYITGDSQYAECAVRICNRWSSTVNQTNQNAEVGLAGIPTYEFAVAAEVLRLYPGWAPGDFERFKKMLLTYFYPACRAFLDHHDRDRVTHYWANWDLCNMIAIEAIGILCDDHAKFNEAVEYFKNGRGNGSIRHAIPFVYEGGLAQWQESGRDQEHTQLGVGMMAMFCQIAWNQGFDLYAYDENRLLKAAEYVARYNLWESVPYTTYNNEDEVNQYWHADYNGFTGGRGRLQRPIWELLYNHYVVLKGLTSPGLTEMAALYRPEPFVHDDNFGFGTLLYTRDAKASPYPPAAVPPAPKGLAANAGVGYVRLTWQPCRTADGYIVSRATTRGGPFTELVNYRGTFPVYTDEKVVAGIRYYYRVAARNATGASSVSRTTHATPVTALPGLPDGWAQADIGDCAKPGHARQAGVSGGTIVVAGSGTSGIGVGDAPVDGFSFVYRKVSGDFTFTARRLSFSWNGAAPSRLGIMIRETLEPDSRMAAIVTGDLGRREARFGGRAVPASPALWQHGNGYSATMTWYRLKRSGDTITAYQSLDGIEWYQAAGGIAVPMARAVHVGLAVSSNNDKLNEATFDHMVIE